MIRILEFGLIHLAKLRILNIKFFYQPILQYKKIYILSYLSICWQIKKELFEKV